jgi:hypothetical protein
LIKSSWFPYLRTIIDLSALISVKNNFLTLLYYGHLSRKITLINSSIWIDQFIFLPNGTDLNKFWQVS